MTIIYGKFKREFILNVSKQFGLLLLSEIIKEDKDSIYTQLTFRFDINNKSGNGVEWLRNQKIIPCLKNHGIRLDERAASSVVNNFHPEEFRKRCGL